MHARSLPKTQSIQHVAREFRIVVTDSGDRAGLPEGHVSCGLRRRSPSLHRWQVNRVATTPRSGKAVPHIVVLRQMSAYAASGSESEPPIPPTCRHENSSRQDIVGLLIDHTSVGDGVGDGVVAAVEARS